MVKYHSHGHEQEFHFLVAKMKEILIELFPIHKEADNNLGSNFGFL